MANFTLFNPNDTIKRDAVRLVCNDEAYKLMCAGKRRGAIHESLFNDLVKTRVNELCPHLPPMVYPQVYQTVQIVF